VIVFTNTITSRLQYIAGFISKQLTGNTGTVTNSVDEYKNYNGIRVNYSSQRISEEELFIVPHTLLFESTIKEQDINCFEWNGEKVFFKSDGDLSYDIFAASFYLLSRYEEYLPHQKDMYGRFAHENSIAFKNDFLNQPLINTWLLKVKQIISTKFPAAILYQSEFCFLPTYDIDEAYSFRHKSWKRIVGAGLKDLLAGRWKNLSYRRQVLSQRVTDPFDAFYWMDELHTQYKLKPQYFFLVPNKTGRYDKNILPDTVAMQTLIQQHAFKYNIGVHPSWQSGDNYQLIKKEIETMVMISGKTITASRQHYIRFTLPETFRYLLNAGIRNDFSMGYGSINGFRASVANPFFWYDLEKEITTDLLLHPFCFMEANSFYEQHLTPAQALVEMQYYYNEVKKVDGTFITIWHNTFLGTDPSFKGWREIYKGFIEAIR